MSEILLREEFWGKDLEKFEKGQTTSKGAQPKWEVIDGDRIIYLKVDYHGYESLAEWVVSQILANHSKVSTSHLVPYHLCTYEGKDACYSIDFRKEDEREIPFSKILEWDRSYKPKHFIRYSHTEKLEALVHYAENLTGYDCEDELRLMFALDSFFLNEDRHTNNFGLLEGDGTYRLTPYFDNGMSLLSRVQAYSYDTPTTTNISNVKPYLLSSDWEKHSALYQGEPILDKQGIQKFIDTNKSSLGRIYDVLYHQLRAKHVQHLFYNMEPKTLKLQSSNLFT